MTALRMIVVLAAIYFGFIAIIHVLAEAGLVAR